MRDNELHTHTAAVLQSHLQRLATDNCIDLRIIPNCKVYSYSSIYRVHMIPVKYIEDYCIGLHELGHSALNHRPEQPRGWKEIAAWAWAKANALFWTDEMEEHATWCLKQWSITDLDPTQFIQPQSLL